jgi:predicted negative regulator of RcsB-dependent stress response
MPFEVKDITDAVGGGGVIGGVVAAVTTFGWWLRKERTETAKSSADVSASNAQYSASESQARQIEALTKRVNEQGDMIIALGNQLFELRERVSSHEAVRFAVTVLLSTIRLSTDDEIRNRPILNEITRLLRDDGIDHRS